MRSALIIIALTLPPVAVADVWDEAYSRGLNAIKAENYGVAVGELQRAIADEPNEFISDQQPKNGWTAYLPHYFLGIAKYNVGDHNGALREWKISEEQGVVPKNPHYAPQLRDWMARVSAPEAKKQTAARPIPAPRTPQPQPAPIPIPTPQPTTTTPTAPSSLPAANIAFNTPDQINLDEHRVIKLLLDLQRPAKELEQQLHHRRWRHGWNGTRLARRASRRDRRSVRPSDAQSDASRVDSIHRSGEVLENVRARSMSTGDAG